MLQYSTSSFSQKNISARACCEALCKAARERGASVQQAMKHGRICVANNTRVAAECQGEDAMASACSVC
jgi:hypothetical protein